MVRKNKIKHFFIDTNALILSPLLPFTLASIPVPDEISGNGNKYLSSLIKDQQKEIPQGTPNKVYISSIVEWELNNIKDDEKRITLDNVLSVIFKYDLILP